MFWYREMEKARHRNRPEKKESHRRNLKGEWRE
jgi:hypothetical protein